VRFGVTVELALQIVRHRGSQLPFVGSVPVPVGRWRALPAFAMRRRVNGTNDVRRHCKGYTPARHSSYAV